MNAPPLPEGFTDRAAWDAIHWKFTSGGLLDQAVIAWQRQNQERVEAAAAASRASWIPAESLSLSSHAYLARGTE